MGRSRYKPAALTNSGFTLNINSMTDMFTILLVFLLQTYTTAEVNIIPEKGVNLPVSNSQNSPVEGVKISLSKEALLLDGQVIAKLNKNQFAAGDVESSDPSFILPLFKALETRTKELADGTKKFNSLETQGIKEGRVLLQADSDFTYDTIRKVMYTASMAGYPQLKLITLVGE